MNPHLQVRQLSTYPINATDRRTQSFGPWHDVTSPAWLLGYILPSPNLTYEFRTKGELLPGVELIGSGLGAA
jgi:hypothetical protein